MATILRNGSIERVSFADTEIDAALLEPEASLGLYTHSGFQRVVDGNAFSGPHRSTKRARRSRRWPLAALFIAACVTAAWRHFS